MYEAAADGRNDTIRRLLAHGANVNAVNYKTDSSALIAAVEHRHSDTVALLLARGANINDCVRFGSPLHSAARRGDLAMVRFLVARGADVNLHDGLGTVLEEATGHTDVVRFLLRHGSAVDKAGKYDTTPLMLAARNGNIASVNILLAHGANVNYVSERQGKTPLELAAEEGHTQVVKVLLCWGASVNLQTEYSDYDKEAKVRTTALQQAKRAGHKDVVRLLKQAGARE